eukprot:scaffold37421_cov39-Phaeocystis_antarctica.AAC.1
MSGHHPATVRRAGRKRGARIESSEALAEQPAVARSHIVTSSLPVRARPLEAPTARFDSRGYQVDGRLRPRAEGA